MDYWDFICLLRVVCEGERAKYPLLPFDTITMAEIQNDLSDLSKA